MKDLIEHRPIPETNVNLDNVVYKCENGSVFLPIGLKQFNPVKIEKKKKVKNG